MRPGAPSPTLPLAYLVTAATAFVIAAVGVVAIAPELAGHYYQPRVLALTHTVTLGWITLTIIGATYQLLPVVVERPIWSERIARWQLALFTAGLVGLIGHFWVARWAGLAWAAGLVAVAALVHVANAGATMRRGSRSGFTARVMQGALAGLALTAIFGFALGADGSLRVIPGDRFARLHAHVHLALLGWVLPMLIGVGARVYPMFLLTREPRGWPGTLQVAGLAAGAPLVVGGLLFGSRLAVASGALTVGIAIAGHLAWVVDAVRTRRRRLDWGMRFAVTGSAFLVPATATGLALAFGVLAGPRVALVYVVLALGGAASLTIVGIMLKLVPFLVWYRVYGARVGRAHVPSMVELSSPFVEAIAYVGLVGGVVVLAVSIALGEPIAIRLSAIVLALGATCFAGELARVLTHLRCAHRRHDAEAHAPHVGRSLRGDPLAP